MLNRRHSTSGIVNEIDSLQAALGEESQNLQLSQNLNTIAHNTLERARRALLHKSKCFDELEIEYKLVKMENERLRRKIDNLHRTLAATAGSAVQNLSCDVDEGSHVENTAKDLTTSHVNRDNPAAGNHEKITNSMRPIKREQRDRLVLKFPPTVDSVEMCITDDCIQSVHVEPRLADPQYISAHLEPETDHGSVAETSLTVASDQHRPTTDYAQDSETMAPVLSRTSENIPPTADSVSIGNAGKGVEDADLINTVKNLEECLRRKGKRLSITKLLKCLRDSQSDEPESIRPFHAGNEPQPSLDEKQTAEDKQKPRGKRSEYFSLTEDVRFPPQRLVPIVNRRKSGKQATETNATSVRSRQPPSHTPVDRCISTDSAFSTPQKGTIPPALRQAPPRDPFTSDEEEKAGEPVSSTSFVILRKNSRSSRESKSQQCSVNLSSNFVEKETQTNLEDCKLSRVKPTTKNSFRSRVK
ncbi:unnamed protein product [Notodromas monacha]|uniref:Uncharacterized protein n=1 Tax=Notodromas monacha TaxID=399045 RepID=A0A7R9GAV3_9CRUS|nr:unnamed protein product [Notodromas monacha]CAG0914123.1 unnamed protein product [Notodromas monacha]